MYEICRHDPYGVTTPMGLRDPYGVTTPMGLRPLWGYDPYGVNEVASALSTVMDVLSEAFSGDPSEYEEAWNNVLPPAPEGADATLSNYIYNGSPLILDLDGDGVETISEEAGVQFDLDNNGFAETVGWAAADDGLLALDRDGDGQITGGNELFGNHTLLKTGAKARHGFEILADYDENSDGVIDQNDAVFSDLKVWRDLNSNGKSEANELQTLDEAGVAALHLAVTHNTITDDNGNEHRQHGSYVNSDGITRDMTDVWFTVDPTRTTPVESVEVPEELQHLPNALGFGTVRSLHKSMALDESGNLLAAA